jgi:adenine phosphoribosyltransferase
LPPGEQNNYYFHYDTEVIEMDFKPSIRVIEDWPKKGISFKDITTMLKDAELLKNSVKEMASPFVNDNVDIVVGPESRGFIFGVPVAIELNAGFVPVRKKGKLPSRTVSATYELEYGTDTLEMHEDAIKKGQRVLLVDDLLATGGTISAVMEMCEKVGAEIVGLSFMIELEFLNGRDKLKGRKINSIVKY